MTATTTVETMGLAGWCQSGVDDATSSCVPRHDRTASTLAEKSEPTAIGSEPMSVAALDWIGPRGVRWSASRRKALS